MLVLTSKSGFSKYFASDGQFSGLHDAWSPSCDIHHLYIVAHGPGPWAQGSKERLATLSKKKTSELTFYVNNFL